MSTNFKIWVDNADATSTSPNVETSSAFAEDSQRSGGFAAGNTVSSLKMNSILRQSSLITVGLMEAFCPSSTLSLTSTLAQITTELTAAIASKASVTALQSQVETLSTTVGGSTSDIASLQTIVNALVSGTTAAGNASKLGGVNASNYQRKISVGTAAPSGGSDGDIYIQYS